MGDIIFTPWIKHFSEIPGYSFFTKEICRRAQFESNNTSTCNVGDLVNGLVVTPAPMMPDEGETSTSGDSSSTSCVGDVLHESDMLEARAGPTTHFVASSVATSCFRSTQKRSLYGQRKEKRNEKEVKEIFASVGNSLKDSRVTLMGEKTPEQFKDRVSHAANSIGRLTCWAHERQRLFPFFFSMDYPYNMLQDLFDCSSKTVAVAKVPCILFGRGGTPPAKSKCTRQSVSPDVLKELSEFSNRESISRSSSCRSVITDVQETPVRYWKDNVKEIVDQYLLEIPNGMKPTFIYTYLPPNIRYNTCLQGFAICVMCPDIHILTTL